MADASDQKRVKLELSELGFCLLDRPLSPRALQEARDILEACWPPISKQRQRIALRHLQVRAPRLITLLGDFLSAIVRPILGPNAQVIRALAFDKRAQANWAVLWHQDRVVAIDSEDKNAGDLHSFSRKEGVVHALAPAHWLENHLTLRLHLDPCDAANGALRVIPGSHRNDILAPDAIAACIASSKARTLACLAGAVFLMRPLLLHNSQAIEGNHRRRVLHFECAPGPPPAPWAWYRPVLLNDAPNETPLEL